MQFADAVNTQAVISLFMRALEKDSNYFEAALRF